MNVHWLFRFTNCQTLLTFPTAVSSFLSCHPLSIARLPAPKLRPLSLEAPSSVSQLTPIAPTFSKLASKISRPANKTTTLHTSN
ncbi:hypothetical protein F4806DRAFT_235431 [Annulohypoxylon nitens]|nr:hypothetical protein F4806DRAFT_235431 [Annulohypoxylon nitens]